MIRKGQILMWLIGYFLESEKSCLNVIFLTVIGRVDWASAAETVDTVLIPGHVKPKTIKNNIHSFPARRSAIKRVSVKSPPCVVGRQVGKQQLDSKTEKSPRYLLVNTSCELKV